MEKSNLENLNRLAKILGADRIIDQSDVEAIKGVLIGVLANNKKELEALTDETKQAVSSILDKVLIEHDTYLEKTKQIAQEAKSETTEAINSTLKSLEEVKALCKEVMECKPENGKDADEEMIIEEVLAKIKLPEYKEVVLDDGGAIVDKINSLPVNEENQIDAKHIKNLPEVKNGRVISGGVTRKIVEQMIADSGAAGVTLKVGGTNNIDQGTLDLIAGSGMTIVDNGDGSVTFTSSGGSGTPGGSTTQLQYNNAGSFGGISGATTNGTSVTLTSPTFITPALGTPASGVATNLTGTAAGLTAGNVTTNANLTGVVTSTGNATAIADAALSIAKTSGLQTALDSKQSTITFGTGVGTALAVNVGTAGSPVVNGGALGTPSSGTVTNLTGTASININGTVGATTPTTGSFTTVTTSGNIELGNASDTTLSRSSAGVLAVEGVVIPSISSTNTLTNKRMQPRTASSTTASTLTPDLSSANVYYRTTQTATLTINAPTGTPVIGETIAIYVDSAGAQTLTMDSTYKVFGAAFPATTTAGKTLMLTAQFNGTDWKTLWANAV